jgi:hypothetical protein
MGVPNWCAVSFAIPAHTWFCVLLFLVLIAIRITIMKKPLRSAAQSGNTGSVSAKKIRHNTTGCFVLYQKGSSIQLVY